MSGDYYGGIPSQILTSASNFLFFKELAEHLINGASLHLGHCLPVKKERCDCDLPKQVCLILPGLEIPQGSHHSLAGGINHPQRDEDEEKAEVLLVLPLVDPDAQACAELSSAKDGDAQDHRQEGFEVADEGVAR